MVPVRHGSNGGLKKSNVISKKSFDTRHQTQTHRTVDRFTIYNWHQNILMMTKTQWHKTPDALIKWRGQNHLTNNTWHMTYNVFSFKFKLKICEGC